MARAYAGSWRSSPPPLDLSLDQLATIHAHLLEMGGVGLVWPRLRDRADELGAVGMALDYAYRRAMARSDDAPARIVRAVSILRDAGIEPVLVKGWSISRMYPAPAVRGSGDIDLVVRPEEVARAEEVLTRARRDGLSLSADLHRDDDWLDLPHADFRDHLRTLDVDGCDVLVPCPEDHLRILCHHFIRHAAFRPLWLCDVALALESRPDDFDWERFLNGGPLRSDWLVTAIGLSHQLLGARIEDTPIAERARAVPSWLVPALLYRWEHNERSVESIMAEVGDRGILSQVSRRRWPDPIGATVFLGAPFNRFPRLPIQWAAFLIRSATYGVPSLFHAKAGVLLEVARARLQRAGAFRRHIV